MHDQMERLAQKDELIAQLRRRLDEALGLQPSQAKCTCRPLALDEIPGSALNDGCTEMIDSISCPLHGKPAQPPIAAPTDAERYRPAVIEHCAQCMSGGPEYTGAVYDQQTGKYFCSMRCAAMQQEGDRPTHALGCWSRVHPSKRYPGS